MKYKLMWWEDNGYHDSYFHGVYFDDADGQLHKADLGATAYGGGIGFDESYAMPTPAVVEASRKLLVEGIYQRLHSAEQHDVMKPADAKPGDILRLSEPHKSRKAGMMLDVGTRIRVNVCNAFGTFYRNGYNKPGRDNRSIVGTVLGQPDKLIRVPLAKCRLDRDLRSRAEELSYEHQYGPLFGMRAWESDNWALEVQKSVSKNKGTVLDTIPTTGQNGAETSSKQA